MENLLEKESHSRDPKSKGKAGTDLVQGVSWMAKRPVARDKNRIFLFKSRAKGEEKDPKIPLPSKNWKKGRGGRRISGIDL